MRHTIKRVVLYVVLIVLAVIWLSPMISIVATSLKSKQDFFSNLSLFQLPETLHWENFKNAFTKGNLFHYMRNDLIICLIKVPLGTVIKDAESGLVIAGQSPDGKLVEIVELPRSVHPWFVAVQFHPEFKSRPNRSHPLFKDFIRASLEQANK